MATKKQITEALSRLDTVEDNMVNQDKQISLLREMVIMQNKSIEFLTQLLNKQEKEKEKESKVEEREKLPDEVPKPSSKQDSSRFGRRAV